MYFLLFFNSYSKDPISDAELYKGKLISLEVSEEHLTLNLAEQILIIVDSKICKSKGRKISQNFD